MKSENGIHYYKVESPTHIRAFLSARDFANDKINHFLFRGCVYADGVRRRMDTLLQPGQVIRLHTRPKTYQWEPGPLKERIVFSNEEFLVLDKPGGLPVHATLDNFVDNAKYILEQELEMQLYSTHRLDIPTAGLLILAKTPEAQAQINKLFAKRQVEKIYFAVTDKPVPAGEHVVFLNPESRVPRDFSEISRDGWWECRLIAELSETLATGRFRHRLRLITGKTHQIRAQLSALGAPIVGDTQYGSTAKLPYGAIALTCSSLKFKLNQNHFEIESGR